MKPVEIYTTQTCPYCIAAKRLLVKKGVPFKEIDVGGQPQLRATMTQRAGGRTSVNDHSAVAVPWVSESDGAELLDRLTEAGVVDAD